MGIGSWVYRNCLKFPWAAAAACGWCIEFLLSVRSLSSVGQASCHPASLVTRFPAPHALVFPSKYCWSAHATLFRHSGFWSWSCTIFLTHVYWNGCSQVRLSSSRILPTSCLKVLTVACLWSQWPVRCSPPYLYLTVTLQPLTQPLPLNLELGLCETQIVLCIYFPTFLYLQIMSGTHWVSFVYVCWLNKIHPCSECNQYRDISVCDIYVACH